jgi:SAM-dependent methyltransferase
MKCRVCQHDQFVPVIDREYPRHLICKNCGFTFMESIKSLQEYYEEDYWDSFHGIKGIQDLDKVDVPSRSKGILKAIWPYLKDGASCLEIGAGFGFTLNYLRKLAAISVFGLEPSKDGCKNMEHNQIPCLQGSLEQFKTDQKFDIIILSHVFEHFQDPELAVDMIRDLVAKDGVVYIEVPNLLQPEFYKNLKFWFSKEHFFYYSSDKLNYFLQKAGYRRIYSSATTVLRAIFVIGEAKALYTKEYSKVKTSLWFHEMMYYPARLVRKISKTLT